MPVSTPVNSALPAITTTVGAPVGLHALRQEAARLAASARAESTLEAYDRDWRHFCAWCLNPDEENGEPPLQAFPASPNTVALYAAANQQTHAVATLRRRLVAISVVHRQLGAEIDMTAPEIRDVMRAIRRERGVAQRQARALTTDAIKRLVATCTSTMLIDTRDRALLLLGFASAARRSEIVSLEIDDIEVLPEGLRVTIRRSKTDQLGAGQVIAVGRTQSATCPVAAYETWLATAGLTEGAAFRSISRHGRVGAGLTPHGLVAILKRRALLAGMDPVGISGHSLRSGLATSAARAGVPDRDIADQTRHRSTAMLARYVRAGKLFARNLSRDVGL